MGFIADDIGVKIDRQGLGDMTGMGGWLSSGEGNRDLRDRWGCAARNSSVVGMLSSRVNEVSSF